MIELLFIFFEFTDGSDNWTSGHEVDNFNYRDYLWIVCYLRYN